MGGDDTETTTTRSGSPQMNAAVDTIGSQLNTNLQRGVRPYEGNLYGGMSQETLGGVRNLWSASNNTGGLNQANNWAQGVIGSGGFGEGQRSSMDAEAELGRQYGQISSAMSGPSAAETGYTKLYQGAGGPSLTEDTLMNVARGGAFGQNEPGYARLRQGALDDAMTGVGSSFLTNGRFGSSVMGDAAGEAATGTLAGLDYQNHQNDIARQERALGAIEGQRQQGFQNQFGALGAADQARMQQLAGRMAAMGAQGNSAQSLFNMGQQGMNNAAGAAAAMPGLYQAGLLQGQTQLGIGQIMDADAQSRIQDQASLFDRTNNAGWNTLERASGVVNGSAGAAGQATTTPTAPWWQSAAGLGIAGLGAFF